MVTAQPPRYRHSARNDSEVAESVGALDAAPITPPIRDRIVGDPEFSRSMTTTLRSAQGDWTPPACGVAFGGG